jgi:type II secretory pathway component GspD/PulD (secretin)
VQYQPIGIILNVTPHINPDGMVILDVAPQVSQISTQTVNIQAGVNAPVFDQRSAQCRVAVRNNQTIVIGGLMQDQNNDTVNKIPLLGDIPYLGALFSSRNAKKSKTELLFFLTPQVAAHPDLLGGMSKEEVDSTKIIPSAVAPGVFQDYMQRMHRPEAATQPAGQVPADQATPPNTEPPHDPHAQ